MTELHRRFAQGLVVRRSPTRMKAVRTPLAWEEVKALARHLSSHVDYTSQTPHCGDFHEGGAQSS